MERNYGTQLTISYLLVLGCNCSALGSESNACDIRTGQCRCKPHVTGRACDTCEEGYWGLYHGGCRRCECGAGAAACEPTTGACACALGVGGARCDRCLPGYYGFGPAGCLPCPECSDGKVCSTANGRCVCPARTRGPGCSQCARGFWGRAHGCLPCTCGPGALSSTCDPVSGQCACRPGWSGRDCERCAEGHFGPRCRLCGCVIAGTLHCRDGVCPCDDHGRCPCKENVVGDKCDTCLEGTFGLSEDNPSGCTACFCFGRSAQCTQAEVTRAALHAPTPLHLTLLRGDSITTVDQDSLLAVHTRFPEATIAVPWPPVPVYVELGELFLGDRVMSYGGALRFSVEEEGGEELSADSLDKFPLVRLYGRNLVLDYYERVPAVNGSHAVWLHESLWRVRGQGQGHGHDYGQGTASRAALMLVLQRLTRVLLRVSTRAPAHQDPVHVLVLKVSLETAVPGLSRGAPALGVERCACPRGYAAASCQRAAAGFWLPASEPRASSVTGTIVISVDAVARPCACGGRATACNPDTGHCLNCTGGTDGAHCERCAPGYFGSPDAPAGCQPCACPSRDRNFASSCAMVGGSLRCRCLPGYTGVRCEACAVGHRRTAGQCVPCTCDARGALQTRCDAHARCRCRLFAAGPRCDHCALPRHFLDEDGCKPCDNCTQTLLNDVERLTTNLRTDADLTELSRIPQPFPALREYAHNTSSLRNDLFVLKKDIEQSRNVDNFLNDMEVREHGIFTIANRVKLEAARREKEAQYLSLESMSWLEEVLKQRRLLGEQVAALDDFARGEKHMSAHRAIKEARHLLKNIREITLSDYMTGAADVSDSANVQSTAIQEYKYRIEDMYKRLHKLQTSLEEWEKKADDLPRLADIVWTAGDTVSELRKQVTSRLAHVRDVGLRCRLMLEDIPNLSSHNMTDETRSLLLQTQNLAVGFPALNDQLVALTNAAEEKEGILYNLTPTYKQKYLEAVEKHAAELGKKAREYKSLFAGTRALASAGVQAAHAWAEVAEGVGAAAAAASAAAVAASAAGKLARGPSPLLHTAEAELRASEHLKVRGAAVLARADELRRQLEQARRGADVVSVELRALGWKERALGGGGSGDGSEVREVLGRAGSQADRVFVRARALYDEAAELRRRARYQLRRRLADLQRLGDTALGAAQEHVSQIRGNTIRGAEVAEALAAAAAARAREHQLAAAVLDAPLAALRHRAARARHAAASISVSVTSPLAGPGCARAFAVNGGGSVTRLALAVSFDGSVRNGTLLLLKDLESERYMKLSVEKERLRLTWDVGTGEGVITHPEHLQPTHDDADHMSYRIEIERVWSTVRLRVERAGASAVMSSNSTGAGAGAGAGALAAGALWLGEEAAPLAGCVHALHADERALGLWAFARQPPAARCVACTHRWYSAGARGEPGMAWFGGAGYAELRRAGARAAERRHFSLSFTFRTRDEDALLFMALDEANNRSVSVELVSCRVVFRVVYSRARLEIATGGRHCDGRPAHVQAIRVFAANKLEKGSLRVNGEETLGSPSPPVQEAAALPEPAARFFVGGAPPGAPLAAPLAARPLLGCLGALTVDRQGYDLMDTPYRHDVERSCGAKVYVAKKHLQCSRFQQPYDLQRANIKLSQFNSMAEDQRAKWKCVVCSSKQPKTDNTDTPVRVGVEGVNRNRGAAALTPQDLLDDNRAQSETMPAKDLQLLIVEVRQFKEEMRATRLQMELLNGTLAALALRIDESDRKIEKLVARVGLLEDRHANSSTSTDVGSLLDTIEQLKCDLNERDQELLCNYIEITSIPEEKGENLIHIVTTLAVKLGVKLSENDLISATRVGMTLRSAIVSDAGYIELAAPALRRRSALGLSFRSRAGNALLLCRAPAHTDNTDDNDDVDPDDDHYLALAMVEGELEVIAAAGKGELRLRFNGTKFNDGRTHTVRIVRAHKQVEVWADARRLGAGALSGGGLAARARGLYLAGAPHALRKPSALPTTGLAGTVADFIVDSELIGLESAVSWRGAQLGRAESEPRAQSVEPHALHTQPEQVGCAKTSSYTVEAGAVKFGDVAGSHATLKLPSKRELMLALHFRTFAHDGLLLLLPGSKTKPKHYMALMIREGKLKLIVRGRRRRELNLAAFVADGTWRAVSVRVGRSRLILESGGAAATARAPPLARSARLYVGGLPAPATVPHLPNSIVRTRGFVGCVRRVNVNGRAEDLVRNAQAHRGVGQCFPNVERAAYFAGDAYAVWATRWWTEDMESAELKLQFRSTSPNGVLLASNGFVLELKDGAVLLSVGEARVTSLATNGRVACDGTWHSVHARVSHSTALLALDTEPEQRAVSPAASPAPSQAPAPLHVAALPEGASDTAEGRENFKGCIRDVSVAGQTLDWSEMESLHNVLLDSCPIPQ
ncbi:unnamed protein product [Parnassius apollo]|uniref:(apollo) hypothetical protein n=1 Tax=Parnassius apollo TaxID=110799 RepID=A0A8S3Y678_PARAO|nr:unnamed protein product [Parnassius apollo]